MRTLRWPRPCASAACRTRRRSRAVFSGRSATAMHALPMCSRRYPRPATTGGGSSSRTSRFVTHRPRRTIPHATSRDRGTSRERMRSYDVITMGRVSVDLYPEQLGVPLAKVSTFAKSLGGSATNVAVAAARLGRRSSVITKVGADGFGDYVREALASFGVDPRFVGTDARLRTPLVFCEIY